MRFRQEEEEEEEKAGEGRAQVQENVSGKVLHVELGENYGGATT